MNVTLFNQQGDSIEVPEDRADDLIARGWLTSLPDLRRVMGPDDDTDTEEIGSDG